MQAVLRAIEPDTRHPGPTAPRRPAAPAGPAPADRWTWRTPAGRALSGATAIAAFGTGLALGGALSPAFWGSLVAPDLVFLRPSALPPVPPGILPPDNVPLYNRLHDPRVAAGLLATGALTASRTLLLAGLGWTVHIAADRAFGYGTRRADGAIH
ncbi:MULTISPECIES: DUF4260 family protein [unclassified Streptomyces]|jgi:hypothetical protein|uniref:DUF4260 family protein n=1 Tax=Streptomyces thermocoprophilus TaxID=78356 RepID=A0ABV5V938_9ACTN